MLRVYNVLTSYSTDHGRPQGGGKRGHLPPLEIQKYGGPPKDNLTRKNYKKKYFKN